MKKLILFLSVFLIYIACSEKKSNIDSYKFEHNVIINTKPNIILFLADDMGWGDAGCYGQEKIKTPNLDKMAANGIRFTDAYTGAPVCAPARSTLMEGLHNGHATVRNNRSIDKKEVNFSLDNYTIAQMLKDAGYKTGIFGKWGLGAAGSDGVPNKQGFDEFWGFLNQRKAHHYYVDSLWHNEELIPVKLNADKNYASSDWYLDKALDFIEKEAKTNQPFFAYIPTQLPHLYMPYSSAEIYKDKDWPIGDKRWATMIHTIDQHMGKLMKKVDELGISENTIILFLSDNGGGDGQRHYYHNKDFFKSNGPFRGVKRDLFEGGIRVPFIVQWKGMIPPHQVSSEPVAYYDLMKTFSDLAGDKPPNVDGESIAGLLNGSKGSLNRPYLYWEFPYMDQRNSKFAIRKGKWKGVKEWAKAPIQIYNLEDDPEELFNWHYERPDLVKEFETIIKKEHQPSPYWPLKNE